MNPLSIFPKHAMRALLMLIAAGTLIVAAGCGGSGNHGGGGGGGGNGNFSKASLNGKYAFSQKGIALVQGGGASDYFSEAGVFTADGNGNLTNIIDEFTQSGGFSTTFNAPLTGAYGIAKDGTGFLTFNFGGGVTSNFQITLLDTTHFYLIEQDFFATGAGSGEKQDAAAFNTIPSGNFIFAAHDLWFGTSRVGSLSMNTGVITGLEDLLVSGGNVTSPSFTGTIAAPDSNGRGQITLSDGSLFYYYVVSSGKFRFLASDGTLELGVAEAQTGAPFSLASLAAGSSYVFGGSGDTSVPVGIHSAGVFTTDGNGGVTAGATDYVQDGAIFSNVAVQNTSDYTLASNGRGELNLDLGNGGANHDIFWMVNASRAYFLVDSSTTLEDGTFSKQQGAPFSNASLNAQAALVMDGFDQAFKDRVGLLIPNGSGTFNWSQEATSYDASLIINPGVGSFFSTNGTNQVDSNGRVTVTVNSLINGSDSSMVFYLVSDNTGFMVQEDQGFDIGGAFTQQTGP
jgi:hypothetical protein